ncbi:MAG TPA: hypothetical protein VE619_07090 [Nitrososphaeraceae archaeon]|nr:hypothetical protein [Nitrososphaeraceae archaeon]
MSKKTKKINNSKDYEKSSFKGIIEDMEDTKNVGLKSVPKIRREQVPSAEETSKEILYGNGDSDEEKNNE